MKQKCCATRLDICSQPAIRTSNSTFSCTMEIRIKTADWVTVEECYLVREGVNWTSGLPSFHRSRTVLEHQRSGASRWHENRWRSSAHRRYRECVVLKW